MNNNLNTRKNTAATLIARHARTTTPTRWTALFRTVEASAGKDPALRTVAMRALVTAWSKAIKAASAELAAAGAVEPDPSILATLPGSTVQTVLATWVAGPGVPPYGNLSNTNGPTSAELEDPDLSMHGDTGDALRATLESRLAMEPRPVFRIEDSDLSNQALLQELVNRIIRRNAETFTPEEAAAVVWREKMELQMDQQIEQQVEQQRMKQQVDDIPPLTPEQMDQWAVVLGAWTRVMAAAAPELHQLGWRGSVPDRPFDRTLPFQGIATTASGVVLDAPATELHLQYLAQTVASDWPAV